MNKIRKINMIRDYKTEKTVRARYKTNHFKNSGAFEDEEKGECSREIG